MAEETTASAVVEKPEAAPEEVGFGDKRVELATFDRFKLRKGITDRIAVVNNPFPRAYIHFTNGKSFRCLSKPNDRKICCVNLGEPNQKFGLIIFHYTTDGDGEFVDPTKCAGKMKLWIITEARYEELSQLHRKFPLLDAGFGTPQHDITLKCTEEQYQKATIVPCGEAHWKRKQTWFDALKQKEIKAKDKLGPAMGKKLTEMEVMELLGASTPAAPGSTANAGDVDLADVLDD